MTLQTAGPLEHLSLSHGTRVADAFAGWRADNAEATDPLRGGLELNAPYQRGEVWTVDQQRLLIKSFLLGAPVPAVIVNNRMDAGFRHPDGREDWRFAVVDGKQRVTAVLAWLDGELAIPASWLPAERVERTVGTGDGPYVTRSGLTTAGDRLLRSRMQLPVAEAHLPSLREEAELFLLVNRGGTAMTDDDFTAAENLAV